MAPQPGMTGRPETHLTINRTKAVAPKRRRASCLNKSPTKDEVTLCGHSGRSQKPRFETGREERGHYIGLADRVRPLLKAGAVIGLASLHSATYRAGGARQGRPGSMGRSGSNPSRKSGWRPGLRHTRSRSLPLQRSRHCARRQNVGVAGVLQHKKRRGLPRSTQAIGEASR